MWRELKGLGLNSCVALRKPLISEDNQKKGFSLLGSIKIGLWSDGQRSCGLMSPDWPCPEWWEHQGKKRGDEVMLPSCLAPTVRACGGSVMIWGRFSRSGRGSATLCAQKMRSADSLNILNEQVFPSMDFLGHIPRWQCHDSSGSNCERVVQGAWDIIFTHGLATTESRP